MAVTVDLSVSLDLIAAGEDQTREHPFGSRLGDAEQLHAWMFEHPDDNADELAAMTAPAAYVMGRHMFGPDRGEWDLDWTGWWGPEPPYHGPVFVVCSRPREPVEMEGGTTFHFVTDGGSGRGDLRRPPRSWPWTGPVGPVRVLSPPAVACARAGRGC